MANPNLTTVEIQPSKPVKTELFKKVKDINDDVETRLTAQENVATSQPVFQIEKHLSNPTVTSPDLILCHTPKFKNAVTLTSSLLTLMEKTLAFIDDATVNGLEIDVQKSTGGILDADFTTSIYTVKPYISFKDTDSPTAGDGDAGTFDVGEIDIAAGERLRLVLTGMPANSQLVPFMFELFI